MADGLSIITGISMLVFLLFYLAFNLNDRQNKVIFIAKIFLIFFGLVLLLYIPASIQTFDRDCAILSNGTYTCYLSNGSQVSDYGTGTTNISTGIFVNYVNFIYMAFAFLIISGLYIGAKGIIGWRRKRRIYR